jgi:hypothetical protein
VAATRRPRRARRARPALPSGRAALRALSSSALALGGFANPAAADGRAETVHTEFNTSRYRESPIESSQGLPDAERDRMEVSMQQLLMRAPLPWTQSWDFGTELVIESMSGATPWYSVPDAAGTPIQVMSGATVEDARRDVNLSLNHYRENSRIGLGTGYSSEKDYSAFNFSCNGETHFNEKNTTLSGGLGLSLDEIEPVETELFTTRPDHEEKRSLTLFGGLGQLLNRRSLVQSSLTYTFGSGYLSDPYKQVFIQGGTFLADSRPDARHSLAWLTRYRRHVEELEGTLSLDFQYYLDTWDISSYTVDLAWHHSYSESLSLFGSVRWYSQSEADFYVPYFNSAPAQSEYSSDYRLSAFGAVGFGIGGEYRFRTRWTGRYEWHVKLSWENYRSSPDLAHGGSGQSPGLVNWSVLSLGIAARF